MRISSKGNYALMVMVEMAHEKKNTTVSIKTLAARLNLSLKYLEHIVGSMSSAGFIKSIRGSHGGYIMTKNAEEITVGMVLRAIEGDLWPVSGVEKEKSQNTKELLLTYSVWEQLYHNIEDVVDQITLEDLVRENYEDEIADYYVI